MNEIVVKNGCVALTDSDEKVEVTLSDKLDTYDIVKLNVKVKDSTIIDFDYKGTDTKIDVKIEVEPNVNLTINEIKEEENIKVQNKYYLNEKSIVTINKFYDCSKVKELDLIFLNGEDARIDYNFKVISKDYEQYDMIVYHNHYRTICNINNKGITKDNGSIIFNVTGIVYNTIKGCIIDQKNRIINLNDSESTINPNLLIEEDDVIANHSAYIGKFNEDELFYLMSRGISLESARNLLIKGFLYDENKKVMKILDKYWR